MDIYVWNNYTAMVQTAARVDARQRARSERALTQKVRSADRSCYYTLLFDSKCQVKFKS